MMATKRRAGICVNALREESKSGPPIRGSHFEAVRHGAAGQISLLYIDTSETAWWRSSGLHRAKIDSSSARHAAFGLF